MKTIEQDWSEGNGCPGTLVIDGHIHIGDWPHNTTFYSVSEAVERSIEYLDTNGVDAACVVGGGYMFGTADYRLGNDFLLSVCDETSDRLIGFAHINPNDNLKAIIAELDRVFDCGIRCIKLINDYQEQYPGDGPNLMAVYTYAAEHRMLIFNHSWTNEVILKISDIYKDIDFIFGHYSPRLDKVLKEKHNVYTNIWSYGSTGWMDRGIKNVGAEKFMMGSDGFLNCMSVGIGPVVFADISESEKKMILGKNIARLLGKVDALPQRLSEQYPALP